LIWPATFAARLDSWNQLRDQCQNLSALSALEDINSWWFQSPWRPYYLHWDDQNTWPDPWQLLSDDIYCEVARGLGILYTVTLLDRADLAPASLILTADGTNLVQVGREKYILNWEANTVVNTNLEFTIQRQYQQQHIK
jgi:hypothetical protein